MTEIPEHLRKRAAEAKQKAQGGDAPSDSDAAASGGAGSSEASSGAASKIPAHLLERSKSARQRGDEGASTTVAPAAGGAAVATAVAAPAAVPNITGPAGHTQRLLTVVKSGSIQDIKAQPMDKVHTWPHLIVVEFGASLFCTVFLTIFSIFVNAPLLRLADVNATPNPSKAPWYFLGLQELLTMFHPMVAGVTIPGIGLFALMLAPYIDKNPSNKPENRKFAISVFTFFMMFWAVLVIIGSFFRGPGFNFVFPWVEGIFFDL
ncbi:MAG: menaquinol-cytochrome c reductase cytochrome b subunit [Phycisphaerae bacterium]|nr:menaquinol-cytochrome c reductase cytochrome b subunit [Phycisphaerae bacterium]